MRRYELAERKWARIAPLMPHRTHHGEAGHPFNADFHGRENNQPLWSWKPRFLGGIRDLCLDIIDRLSGPERPDRDKIYTRSFMNIPMNSRRSPRFSRLSPEEKVGSALLRLGFWLYDRRPFRAEK
jgi:hypothetical protein